MHPVPVLQRAVGHLPDETADRVQQAVDAAKPLNHGVDGAPGGGRIGQVDAAEAHPVVAVRALNGAEVDGGHRVAARQGGVRDRPSEHA
ncbi:hypothetical protein D3C86_2013180 [compost metagenome]